MILILVLSQTNQSVSGVAKFLDQVTHNVIVVSSQITTTPASAPKASMVISSIGGELPAMMDVVAVATPIPAVVPTRIGGKFRKLCSITSFLCVAPTRIRSKFSGFLSGALRAVRAVMHVIPDIMNSPEIPISAFLSNDIIMGGC